MSKRHLLAALALAVGGTAFAGSAHAVAPDYQKYCSQQHPGSFVTRNRATNEAMCTLRSAYSLVHYRINIAYACQLTTGSAAARSTGGGNFDCVGGSTTTARNGQVMHQGHYQRYCNGAGGGQASFSYQLNDWVCSLKTAWNRLEHRRVNYGQACYANFGSSSPRAVGGDRRHVMCVV
jgi:hypothetical protein